MYSYFIWICRIGLSFGIVAASQNFSILEIILLCLIIYAGAAQFIVCAFSDYRYSNICYRSYHTYR